MITKQGIIISTITLILTIGLTILIIETPSDTQTTISLIILGTTCISGITLVIYTIFRKESSNTINNP